MSAEISDLLERKLPLIGRYLTASLTPASNVCRRLIIPDVPEFHAAIGELLSRLCYEDVWEERAGGLTPIDMVMLATQMLSEFEEDNCVEAVKAEWIRLWDWELEFNETALSFVNYFGYDYSAFRIIISPARVTASADQELMVRYNNIASYDYPQVYSVFDTGVTNNSGYYTSWRIPAVLKGVSGGYQQYVGHAEIEITNIDDASFPRAQWKGLSRLKRIEGAGYVNNTTVPGSIYTIDLMPTAGLFAAGTKFEVYGRKVSDGLNYTED